MGSSQSLGNNNMINIDMLRYKQLDENETGIMIIIMIDYKS